MYNVSAELEKFYADHVRLGSKRRAVLADHRDKCIERVRRGLRLLLEDGLQKCGPMLAPIDQGSYAMHTLNQREDNDYDLDEALIFPADTLPASAVGARKRVVEALQRDPGAFLREPEARANAVTVWYSEGHHIDLAIYRQFAGKDAEPVLEHAGPEWAVRDPREVNSWFSESVKRANRTSSADQLRRVVRFVKAFCRSRPSWSLPGGMITTTLVEECFVPDPDRDDVALVATVRAIRTRLRRSCEVNSPVDSKSSLTGKEETAAQVRRLLERLGEAVTELAVLDKPKCTEVEALSAWKWFFRHGYWGDVIEQSEEGLAKSASVLPAAPFRIEIAKREGARPDREYRSDGMVALPKGVSLRFTLLTPALFSGCTARWIVRNRGDEAELANHLTHENNVRAEEEQWERTAYKGLHTMTCEVIRNGVVVARSVRRVAIGSR